MHIIKNKPFCKGGIIMEQDYELTTTRYFLELTKLFFQSAIAYYYERDDSKLEKLYYKTMDVHDQYIEIYCDEEEKQEKYKDRIYELIELISLREQEDVLRLHTSPPRKYKGIKLKENIINNMYVELWLIEGNLQLYIFERKNIPEQLILFKIEDPYLLSIDQVYYALKNKRAPGLLSLLYEKKHE